LDGKREKRAYSGTVDGRPAAGRLHDLAPKLIAKIN